MLSCSQEASNLCFSNRRATMRPSKLALKRRGNFENQMTESFCAVLLFKENREGWGEATRQCLASWLRLKWLSGYDLIIICYLQWNNTSIVKIISAIIMRSHHFCIKFVCLLFPKTSGADCALLFDPSQFGFHPFHSTEAALTATLDFLLFQQAFSASFPQAAGLLLVISTLYQL